MQIQEFDSVSDHLVSNRICSQGGIISCKSSHDISQYFQFFQGKLCLSLYPKQALAPVSDLHLEALYWEYEK